MPNTVKRLNYYDHQFLRVPEFTDEQNYHLNMRRLHNSLLHTWGIVQGLEVTATSGGTGTAVTVSAGVALDSTGRELVLPGDKSLELGGESAGTTLYITITYDEQPSDPTSEAGGPGMTRMTELPIVSFSKNAPGDKSMTLILAKVPRTTTGLGPVDGADRKQAGVALGNDLTLNTLTLKKDAVAQANWPALSCSAANQAALTNGNLSLDAQRELSFADNGQIRSFDQNHKLAFNRSQNLLELWEIGDIRFLTGVPFSEKVRVKANGNVGIGTANPPQQLTITGGLGFANQNAADKKLYSPADGVLEWMTHEAAGQHGFAVSHQGQQRAFINTNGNSYLNGGNLGIGLANPNCDLTIYKAGPGTGVYENVKNDKHEILIGVDSAAIVSAITNSDLQLRTNNANRVVVSAGTGTLTANADIRLANSDIYFTKTDHNHSGFGNTPGFAAIENAANFNGLMILGRQTTAGRLVRLWDFLQVNGNLEVTGSAAKPGGGAWTALSDKRLKKNLNPLSGALDKLLSLRGVTFEWKEPEKYGNLVGTQVGFVAQEVEQIFPEWVGVDSEGFKTVTVRGLEALVIEAFREIKQEISALKDAVAGIQSKLGIEAKEQKPADKTTKPSARKTDAGQKK